jgi:hypothetical protein
VLGAPIRDAATGEELGRRERRCCTFTVEGGNRRITVGRIDADPALREDEVLHVRPRHNN